MVSKACRGVHRLVTNRGGELAYQTASLQPFLHVADRASNAISVTGRAGLRGVHAGRLRQVRLTGRVTLMHTSRLPQLLRTTNYVSPIS